MTVLVHNTLSEPARPWLPWLALGLVGGAAGLVGGHWWWLALTLAPLAALLDRRWPDAARVAIAAAAICAGGWLAQAVDLPLAGPRLLTLSGTVSATFHPGWKQTFLLVADTSDDPGGYLPRRLFVSAPGLPDVRDGDRVTVRGRWQRTERGDQLTAMELERTVMREDGPRGFAWQTIDRLNEHQGLAEALLLGLGSPPEKELFRRTGLIHLLAVSGMHLALAAAMGAWLLRHLRVPWSWRQGLLAALLIGYTWLTAASPATVRALAMSLALVLFALLAREPHRLGAVSLAALTLVLWDPTIAHDLGFQLSLAAVLGLMTLGVDLMRLRERLMPLEPWPLDRPTWRLLLFGARSTCDGLCIGVAATLATAPILALAFGTISPWSAVTTLLASPPTTLALWTGLPLMCVSGIWPNGPWEGLFQVLEGALSALVWTVEVADKLPGRIAVPLPPIIIMLLWPLAFLPCERPTLPLAAGGTPPFPERTVIRLGIAVTLLGGWWWCG